MAKRFTDTDKWDRPWFRKLPDPYKILWLYILDKCDVGGIWYVDMELASFMTGHNFDYEDAVDFFSKQVEVLNGGSRWFILDFTAFQYGPLSEDCKTHKAPIQILKKQNLWSKVLRLSDRVLEGCSTLQDKEQDQYKDGSKSLSLPSSKNSKQHSFQKPTPEEITSYATSLGFALDGQKFWDFYESKGWVIGKSPMKDWKRAVSTWKANNYGGSNGRPAKDVGYATAQPGKYPD